MDLKKAISRLAALRQQRARIDAQIAGLEEQADGIDAELVELEPLLPDNYTYPGDPPLPIEVLPFR